MAYSALLLALTITVVASPGSPDAEGQAPMIAAPAGTHDTRYCMRIEADTGSRVEKVRCWTRQKWAEQGVDVDKDWAVEGVRTIG